MFHRTKKLSKKTDQRDSKSEEPGVDKEIIATDLDDVEE